MTHYARIDNGYVAETIVLPDDITPADAFPPNFAATLVACPADVQQGWTYDSVTFAAPVLPPRTAEQAAAELAAIRYVHEVGGCDVLLPGLAVTVRVATDRESQNKITSAAQAAATGLWPASGGPWKMADGSFVLLTAETVVLIAAGVMRHVMMCYGREAELTAQLATDPTIDLTTGWPGQS